jgi:tripartite-type tricarboxylate transporter receptor subunit TctC
MTYRDIGGKACAANLTHVGGTAAGPRAPSRPRLRRTLGLATAALLAVLALPGSAVADDVASYPNKPIRLVLPYATGGVTDSVGRVLAAAMTKSMGQTVYVENRGGGGGTIGAAHVAKAAPDGYTIVLTSPPMVAVAPALLPTLPYDALEDFTPIGTFITTPNILVVNPALPIKSMADLVAYAKSKAGKDKLSYASAGPGSTGHLSGHILKTAAGFEMPHIPYKSSGQAFPDVMTGRVSMVFDSLPSTIGHVRAGKVRPIAVMSETRSNLLPDIPTAAESGFPAATMVFWMGIEGPPKMPVAIVEKLNAGMRAAMASPEMRSQLAVFGAEPFITSPQEFNTLRRRDVAKLRQLAKDMGLKPQ